MKKNEIEQAIDYISTQIKVLEDEVKKLKDKEYIEAYEFDIQNKKLSIQALIYMSERLKIVNERKAIK